MAEQCAAELMRGALTSIGVICMRSGRWRRDLIGSAARKKLSQAGIPRCHQPPITPRLSPDIGKNSESIPLRFVRPRILLQAPRTAGIANLSIMARYCHTPHHELTSQ
eukprot:2275695-Rhodomonas_salina.1